jgi:DNA-binding beta-propeller fold protein YncE
VVVLALSGCAAHRPQAPQAAEEEVTFPEAPARPRVRLVAILPSPPEERRSTWRRIWEAIAGLEPADRPALQRPFGVAIAPTGEPVVADPDLGGLFRITGGDLAPVTCPDREWQAPIAVVSTADGALLVADAAAAEVVQVSPGGACTALGAGELERPTGLAVDGSRVYVADPPRHELVVLAPEGTTHVGSRGDAEGQFSFPSAVAVAPDRTVLVVDSLNFRVVRLSSSEGWITAFGEPGDAQGEFERPKGIAVDAGGRIYVSDAQRDLVLVYRSDGTFDYAIGGTGTSPGRFTHPAGLAIAGARLYVADSQNRRIQVFEIIGERS